jgi:nitrite reductase (NADH) large subunit
MRIVIIGAGPAGVSVAETVRQHDGQAELLMLSAEPYPPYSPPAMVDHFLKGTQAHFWRGEDFTARLSIDYRSGVTVVGVEPEAHRITLADGGAIDYDRLVVATGSRLYAPLEGIDLPGVYNFKSLSAAEELVGQVRAGQAKTAIIVGAGFIGMEVALVLRGLGMDVIQLEMMNQVMPHMLDAETAAVALEQMRERGVDVRLNTEAKAFVGDGRAEAVELASGQTLRADILIAATGVKPNVEFLEGSGVECEWGIAVDEHLCTSAPDVYAAGDAVEAPDRLTGEPYVHAIFPNAIAQGQVVGLNLLGYDVTYEGADSMNSLKHLGLQIMAVGRKEGDEVLRYRRGEVLRTIYLEDNRIVGFQMVSDISAAGVLRELMNRAADIHPIKNRLLDPAFGQGMLVWAATAGTVV